MDLYLAFLDDIEVISLALALPIDIIPIRQLPQLLKGLEYLNKAFIADHIEQIVTPKKYALMLVAFINKCLQLFLIIINMNQQHLGVLST